MLYLGLKLVCVDFQVIRRKVVLPAQDEYEQPFKVTLHKKSKKDGKLLYLCV